MFQAQILHRVIQEGSIDSVHHERVQYLSAHRRTHHLHPPQVLLIVVVDRQL